jgi:hypothetical protein
VTTSARLAEYVGWSFKNVRDPHLACVEATLAMVAAFPELSRVRGHYHCPVDGQAHPHWWCVTAEGTIIDPTADQFASHGQGDYEPYDESKGEPLGKCLDCGGLVYRGDPSPFCSDACAAATRAFMARQRGALA